MKPCIRAFFIAAYAAAAAFAQQETNPPPAELQSPALPTEERPEDDRIKFLLDVGSAYLVENDPASAISAYERVLEIDPQNREARFKCSTLYISTKQYAEAKQLLDSLLEDFPKDFQTKNNLAWLYATAENPEFRDAQKAIELAQEAMVAAPNIHNVWSTLAEAYYSAGQYEKADRASTQMASLANRYGSSVTKEAAASYNAQIRKYKRALETEKALKAGEEEESPAAPSVDEDAQKQES